MDESINVTQAGVLPSKEDFYSQIKALGIRRRYRYPKRNHLGGNPDRWIDYSYVKRELITPLPLSNDQYDTMINWLCDWLMV